MKKEYGNERESMDLNKTKQGKGERSWRIFFLKNQKKKKERHKSLSEKKI
jgi:hypothetical protein